MKKRSRVKSKIIIGITGSFGSGKSTVAGMFVRLSKGRLIDADKIAHGLLKPGTGTYKKIVSVFHEDILKKDRTIDRKILAEKVFCSRESVRCLNRILHPHIINRIRKKLREVSNRCVVLDAALLIEAGLAPAVHTLVVVSLGKKEQFARLKKKRRFTVAQIKRRLSVQMPLHFKIRQADFVIDNSFSRRETNKQVKEVWKSISS